ncbi:MAG: FadR family transcriptional regulator [Fusobacteriaceae bacterium]|jgi:DNA-binding FadR family transcriptional regulator|nr:FadR family transcriptional regulator [Fusobacteriaceae bacterium]
MASKLLTEKIAEDIIQLIRNNKMKPGDKLANEYELAKNLNAGRGSIREAIKLLVSRNILLVRQGAGTFVSREQGIPIDPLGFTFIDNKIKLASDLLEIRLILEPEIAAMAATYATKTECENILNQCDIVEKLIEEKQNHDKADADFHKSIAIASGNLVTANLIPIIHTSVSINIDLTKNELTDQTCRYHRIIAESISKGDVQEARYAMIMHINFNREALAERYKIDKRKH